MEMKSSTANYGHQPKQLTRWSGIGAVVMFMMALVIFLAYETPAICYQLSIAFGMLFSVNGLLGMTKFSPTKGWLFTSYFIGIILSLFGFASFFRQISKGQRGMLVGTDFYSILVCLAIIGSLGLVYTVMTRREFRRN